MRLLFVALLSLAGCGDPECVDGSTGVCDDYSCAAGGCSWEGDVTGVQEYTCDGGDCTLDVTGAGDATLDCAGGGCTVTASGQGSVTVHCSGGSCDMTCSGQGTCVMDECDDGTCTNECTVVTATCEGP